MVSKSIIVIMAIVALVGTIGLSPAFADWDKTKYPSIEGTIPVDSNENYSNLAQITLVDAMTIAEGEVVDSKSMYAKLSPINGYLVYKVVMSNDNHEYNKVLVDAGTGDVLYVTESKSFDSNKKKKHSENTKENKHDKRMKDYYKDMTPEQIAEKKKQFKEMGEAWKSLSIPDKAAMIVHFMQMKLQWDTMSEEQKEDQKAEMKEKWKGYLTLSPEEKKQKLEEFAQTVK
ncbi:PepSY domain-containing protein [Nitrosopumilus sp.]|nr:PepSY domain-containing protein [Nitrosopumilus sp.]MDC0204954.1 PepSY domain-containing protein [Nitrosopumilus sp.]MDC0329832.1 PepSY domain-containing protein [Nitrosopumilus sp.]